MTTQYKSGKDVPSDVLCARLNELAKIIAYNPTAIDREFSMRIPAELDRDADCVLSEAARRITELEAYIESAKQSGWQPIETAPKDGTIVDLWVVETESLPKYGETSGYRETYCMFYGREWVTVYIETWAPEPC
jgi:hypothetical protein